MERICKKCGEKKDESKFRKKVEKRVKMTVPFYFDTVCKSCRNKDAYLKQKETASERGKKYWQKQKDLLSDQWVIKVIMADYRFKGRKINREDITEDMVNVRRAKILIHRLKNNIETVSKKGVCKKCKSIVLLSEFKKREKTEKRRGYLIRICKKCK